MDIFDRDLLVVTGKGGVGKTTVSIVLAMIAARQGRKVCLVEMDRMNSVASSLSLAASHYEERPIAPGLTHLSLDPLACANEFGQKKLRIKMLAQLVFKNRLTAAFFNAIPGLNDLLQMGKIENLLTSEGTPFDLVILDAPATGHGLTLLSAAESMAEMTRMGPFFELARSISQMLSDPKRTGIVISTLPELLPVRESLDLRAALSEQGLSADLLVINQCIPHRLPANSLDVITAMRSQNTAEWSITADRVQAALNKETQQRDAIQCLSAGQNRSFTSLTLQKAPGGRLRPDTFEALVLECERQLGATP